MKKNLFFIFALIGSALLVSSCCKNAAQTEEKPETIEVSEAVSAFKLAGELSNYGQNAKSALALINAADILASTPQSVLDAEFEGGNETPNESEKSAKVALDPIALLELAKEYANDDEHLLTLIAEVESKLTANAEAALSGTRGAFGGAKSGCGTVYARNYDTYNILFNAGTVCNVAVVGDGDTDLDLYVYDLNGNLICSDVSYSDNCLVSFIPYYTTTFKIKVVNRGAIYNNYCIATN